MIASRTGVADEGRVWARVAAAVGLLQLLAFADRFLLSLVAAPVARALRLDDLQLGILQGVAFILPFALATLTFGRLGDRVPPRRLLFIGFALWTGATAWSGLVANARDLYAARLLLSVGEAVVGPVGLALIARTAPAGRTSFAVSMFSGAGPLGKGSALVGGGVLLALFAAHPVAVTPWRAVFLVAAATNLALAPAVWRGLKRLEDPGRSSGGETAGDGREHGLLTPRVLALAVAGCAAVLASQSLGAWAPAYLHREFGASIARAGALAGAPLMLASPLGGALTAALLDARRSRAGPRRPHGAAVALSLTFAGGGAWLFFSGAPEGAAMTGFVVLALALGAAIAAFLSAMQLHQPRARRAEFASWVVLAPNLIGFGVGPALTGYISTAHGGSADSLRSALLTVLGGACAAGATAAAVSEWMTRGDAAASVHPGGAALRRTLCTTLRR